MNKNPNKKSFKNYGRAMPPEEQKDVPLSNRTLTKMFGDGYLAGAAELADASLQKKGIEIPAIKQKSKEEIQLEADRKEWQKQYSHWLTRKNRKAEKLHAAGKNTSNSPRYQLLDEKVKHFWQLLRDSKPQYKPL